MRDSQLPHPTIGYNDTTACETVIHAHRPWLTLPIPPIPSTDFTVWAFSFFQAYVEVLKGAGMGLLPEDHT